MNNTAKNDVSGFLEVKWLQTVYRWGGKFTSCWCRIFSGFSVL